MSRQEFFNYTDTSFGFVYVHIEIFVLDNDDGFQNYVLLRGVCNEKRRTMYTAK